MDSIDVDNWGSSSESWITFIVLDQFGDPYDGTVAGAVTLQEQAGDGLTDFASVKADAVTWNPNIDADGFATVTYNDLEVYRLNIASPDTYLIFIQTSDQGYTRSFIVELAWAGASGLNWKPANITSVVAP